MFWRLILILIITQQSIMAQNLIRNASFEENIEQPCDFVILSDFYHRYATDWSCPTLGTTDVFSSAIPNKACWAAMPSNITGVHPRIGNQSPRTLQRFAGLYTVDKIEYREYLQAELITPLEPGEYYCASMYVSLADEVEYASNNLGFAFYEDYIRVAHFEALDLEPQVNETAVIQDRTNWIRVYGSFKATGPFRHMAIGNFFNNANTATVLQQGRGQHYPGIAYYFIDDVSVEKLPAELLIAGNRTICEGQSTEFYVVDQLEDITWTTLTDTTATLSTNRNVEVAPTVTTAYRLKGKLCKTEFVDTVTVTVLPFEPPDLGGDIIKCIDDAVQLDAGGGYIAFLWQDNSTDRYFTATTAGAYSVQVTNEYGCSGSASITVEDKLPPFVELGEDVTLCKDKVKLQVEPGHISYDWSNGEIGISIEPRTSGTYWVSVRNECGVAADTVRVFSFSDIYIPNVITLNDDNINEKFEITGLSPGVYPYLKIIDRWGREVFSKNNYQGEWPEVNAVISGGTYYYVAAFPQCRTYKGWIHILK
jgi:hypothetical protein